MHNSCKAFDQNDDLNFVTQYVNMKKVEFTQTYQIKPKIYKKYEVMLILEAFLIILSHYNLFAASFVHSND